MAKRPKWSDTVGDMMNRSNGCRWVRPLLWLAAVCVVVSASAADNLQWRTNDNRVTADIKGWAVTRLLGEVAAATGWRVYLEPSSTHTVSAKFKELPSGEALPMLLGDLNFALVPETNASSKLFVFRTAMRNATQLIGAAKPVAPAEAKRIGNELVVRLKPGANIDDLARQLGAKVVGRIDKLNAYRLRFDDATAADAARQQLAANPDVTAVDNNYSIDRPTTPGQVQSTTLPPPQLQLKPPADSGKVVVGLIDTAVQPLGNNLDQFLLKSISVAGDTAASTESPTHGTSMAETILRSLQEITKGSTSVQILPVDVYGANESTSTFDVGKGVAAAVDGGAKVLSLSLGSEGDSPFLRDLIQQAIQNKILVVAAAGNEPVTTPFYPAGYSDLGVIAVTAVDQGQLASYANRGSFVNAGLPGTSVIYFNGQPYYVTGTSTSAALASGLAAGYMDSRHATTTSAQSFILSNFGVKITTQGSSSP
jgi:thermitase